MPFLATVSNFFRSNKSRDHYRRTNVDTLYFLVLRPSPFYFVYCRMRFLILGRSVGKIKKKRKNKIGKLSGARRPGTLENNKVWLQSQHGGNGGRKNRLRC